MPHGRRRPVPCLGLSGSGAGVGRAGVLRPPGGAALQSRAAENLKLEDWKRVATAAAGSFAAMGFAEASAWCAAQASLERPRKADQDRLDAMLCLLIGLRWRLRPREEGVMLGCLEEGYIVSPATFEVRERL